MHPNSRPGKQVKGQTNRMKRYSKRLVSDGWTVRDDLVTSSSTSLSSPIPESVRKAMRAASSTGPGLLTVKPGEIAVDALASVGVAVQGLVGDFETSIQERLRLRRLKARQRLKQRAAQSRRDLDATSTVRILKKLQ